MFGVYGVALLICAFLTTGTSEGSHSLFVWFCAPATISPVTGLFTPLYWYLFGQALDGGNRRAAFALLIVHWVSAPLAVLVQPVVAADGIAEELSALRFQMFAFGPGTVAVYAGAFAVYLAGQVLAVRAVRARTAGPAPPGTGDGAGR
jgi:hypothetical protein